MTEPPIEATIEVSYTDRSRNADGRFVERQTTVDVLAQTETESHLVAAQLVAATLPPDFMVTRTTTVTIAI